jgi:hypothetical protein
VLGGAGLGTTVGAEPLLEPPPQAERRAIVREAIMNLFMLFL